ncbi:MAG: Mth938-like domain-containing protein [Thermodesulfobacteriota bacterium]
MHIDSYDFGRIVIDGRTFTQDLLIWPGHIKSDWWRGEAHLLQIPDVFESLAADIQVLVVGSGQPGRLEVDPALAAYLREKGIDLVVKPTREACVVINQMPETRRWAAALHLTC